MSTVMNPGNSKNQIEERLAALCPKCPACNSTNRSILGGNIGLIDFGPAGTIESDRVMGIPVTTLLCHNCGFLALHESRTLDKLSQ